MDSSEESYVEDTIIKMAEHKYFDRQIINTRDTSPVDFTGRIYSLTDIPQGYTQKERLGNKITMTSLQVTISIGLPTLGANTIPIPNHIIRPIIFSWFDNTPPAIEDILETTGATDSNVYVLLPLNHDKSVKRKIIFDETFTMSYGLVPAGSLTSETISGVWRTSECIRIVEGIRKSDAIIDFTSGVSGIGKIYLLLVTNAVVDDDPLVNSCWDIFTYTRINYFDF